MRVQFAVPFCHDGGVLTPLGRRVTEYAGNHVTLPPEMHGSRVHALLGGADADGSFVRLGLADGDGIGHSFRGTDADGLRWLQLYKFAVGAHETVAVNMFRPLGEQWLLALVVHGQVLRLEPMVQRHLPLDAHKVQVHRFLYLRLLVSVVNDLFQFLDLFLVLVLQVLDLDVLVGNYFLRFSQSLLVNCDAVVVFLPRSPKSIMASIALKLNLIALVGQVLLDGTDSHRHAIHFALFVRASFLRDLCVSADGHYVIQVVKILEQGRIQRLTDSMQHLSLLLFKRFYVFVGERVAFVGRFVPNFYFHLLDQNLRNVILVSFVQLLVSLLETIFL